MRRFFNIIFALCLLFVLSSLSLGQQTATKTQPSSTRPSPAEIEKIVRSFTTKETEFRRALNDYAFRRDATIQTIGMGGQITGEYHRVSSFVFDDNSNRFEKILFFPMATITEVQITTEDIEDLGGVNAFALEASKINQYTFNYVGREKIDEIGTYVFDVVPKVDLKAKKVSERYFMGRIWVDDLDLQIVKAKGKGVPEGKQRFPTFETYRENVDGKYWFPAYVYADDNLVFDNGAVIHLRMIIKYTDYKRARAEVKVVEGDVEDESQPKPKPTPSPTPKKP